MKYLLIALAIMAVMIPLFGLSSWRWAVQAEPLAVSLDLADNDALPDDDPPILVPIIMTYTVGLDPAICARTKQITVEPGTRVVYCYEMTNNTSVVLTRHDLVDSQLGVIFEDLAYTLRPQATWVITQVFVPPTSAASTAIWTAYDDIAQEQYQAEDSATVIVIPDAFRAYLPLVRRQ